MDFHNLTKVRLGYVGQNDLPVSRDFISLFFSDMFTGGRSTSAFGCSNEYFDEFPNSHYGWGTSL